MVKKRRVPFVNQQKINTIAWSLFGFAIIIPFLSWASLLDWKLADVTALKFFPLLGLWAWMIMWTHYVVGAIRLSNPSLPKPTMYAKVTEIIVLACLILHPGILIYKLNSLGLGTPPDSFEAYVGKGLKLAVFLGTISLITFLSYEYFNRAKNKPAIRRNWIIVSISQSVAMTLIFVHGLHLGTNLGETWFRAVWIACGLALICSFYRIHKADFAERAEK